MSEEKKDEQDLLKQVNLLQRIAFLDGQREMAWHLAINKDGRQLVGVQEIPWEDFVQPIDHELRELRAQAGMPAE